AVLVGLDVAREGPARADLHGPFFDLDAARGRDRVLALGPGTPQLDPALGAPGQPTNHPGQVHRLARLVGLALGEDERADVFFVALPEVARHPAALEVRLIEGQEHLVVALAGDQQQTVGLRGAELGSRDAVVVGLALP